MGIAMHAFWSRATFAWAPRPRRPVDETCVSLNVFVNFRKIECSFGAETARCRNIVIDSSFYAGGERAKPSTLCIPSLFALVYAKELVGPV